MGTHPIFESDFDCLTELKKMSFNSGLFACLSDPGTCILSCFGWPLLVGKNAEKIGENGVLWAVSSMTPCVNGFLRGQIRKKNGIEGRFLTDLLVHCCCPCCAISQESRHLKSVDYLMDDGDLNRAKSMGADMTRS